MCHVTVDIQLMKSNQSISYCSKSIYGLWEKREVINTKVDNLSRA